MKLKMCSCQQCKLGRKSSCERKNIEQLKHGHRRKVKNILRQIALSEDVDLADTIPQTVDIPYNG